MKNVLFMNDVLFLAVVAILFLGVSVSYAGAAVSSAAASSIVPDAGTAISIGLVNQDPDPALAGDTVDVRLSVSNAGSSSADNMIVEVVPSYPFEAVSGQDYSQNIGPLNAFQSGSDAKILKYTLRVNKDATEGTYYMTVKYYAEGSNSSTSQSIPINVGSSQSVEIISIDKTVLVPGQQSGLKFIINNVGGSSLQDLSFHWANSNNVVLPVGSDNTKYIKYLDVGKSVELDYQVIADTAATPGLYPLNLYLSYLDSANNSEKTISTIAGVYVGGGTDFDIAFSEKSGTETSFSVANIGSNPASSVSVIIPTQRNWGVTGSNSMIIGNLNKGDYTVASFALQSQSSSLGNRTGVGNRTNFRTQDTAGIGLAADASGANNTALSPDSVLMQIAYTDTMGNRNIVNKTVKIGLQNVVSGNYSIGSSARGGQFSQRGGSSISSTVWYILGAIILIAGGIFLYTRRRNKKILESSNGNVKELFKTKKK